MIDVHKAHVTPVHCGGRGTVTQYTAVPCLRNAHRNADTRERRKRSSASPVREETLTATERMVSAREARRQMYLFYGPRRRRRCRCRVVT